MTALQEAGPSVPSSDKSTVRVAVVFGGRSGEHTISCATAAGVLSAIDRNRYEVLPVGITPEGQWLLVEDDPAALELSDNRPPVTITAEGLGRGRLTAPLGGGELTVIGPAGPQVLGRVDVVLPLLHGPYGEDGTIQGMLEMMGIPYVGCGVLASAAGMDKQVTKVLLGAAGIATAPHVVVGPHAWKRDPEAILEACRSLTYPLFVKPARAGSCDLAASRAGLQATLRGLVHRREHDTAVVAVLDLDSFKSYNDTYGHLAGDQYLADTASLLRSGLSSALIGRMGGDEFVIVALRLGRTEADVVIGDLRRLVGEGGPIAGSVGLVVRPRIRTSDLPAAIGEADRALYMAKADRSLRIVVRDLTVPGVVGPD